MYDKWWMGEEESIKDMGGKARNKQTTIKTKTTHPSRTDSQIIDKVLYI
jgi:hypothetical protein